MSYIFDLGTHGTTLTPDPDNVFTTNVGWVCLTKCLTADRPFHINSLQNGKDDFVVVSSK